MSVFVVLRVKGDPSMFEKYADANRELMKRVAGEGRQAGAMHHAFAAGDGEIMVIDEWPDEASFQRFYENQPEIPGIMQDGGAQGAPQMSFYRKLETADTF